MVSLNLHFHHQFLGIDNLVLVPGLLGRKGKSTGCARKLPELFPTRLQLCCVAIFVDERVYVLI